MLTEVAGYLGEPLQRTATFGQCLFWATFQLPFYFGTICLSHTQIPTTKTSMGRYLFDLSCLCACASNMPNPCDFTHQHDSAQPVRLIAAKRNRSLALRQLPHPPLHCCHPGAGSACFMIWLDVFHPVAMVCFVGFVLTKHADRPKNSGCTSSASLGAMAFGKV